MTGKTKKQQCDVDIDIVDFPLPKRRRRGDIAPIRSVSKVTKEEAISAIPQAFEKCFTTFITAIIVSEAKKRKKLSESEFDDRMNALKLKISSTKNAPRYIFLDADIIGEYAMYTTLTYMGNRRDVLSQWRIYVEKHFSHFLRDGWQTHQRLAAQFWSTRPLISMPDKERTFRVPLKSVLRSDLTE